MINFPSLMHYWRFDHSDSDIYSQQSVRFDTCLRVLQTRKCLAHCSTRSQTPGSSIHHIHCHFNWMISRPHWILTQSKQEMKANVTVNCVHPGVVKTNLNREREGFVTGTNYQTIKLLHGDNRSKKCIQIINSMRMQIWFSTWRPNQGCWRQFRKVQQQLVT